MEGFVRERYIPALITLVAAAISSIQGILTKVDAVTGLKRLLIVIIIFYIVGLIVKAFVHWALIKFASKEDTEEELEDSLQPEEIES